MIYLNNINIEKLDEIAEKHYNRVKVGIREELEKILNTSGKKRKKLYEYFKTENILALILKGTPQKLSEIILEVGKYDVEFTSKDKLLKVFYYQSYGKWKPYELANDLGITSCCYCNRQYTIIVGDDKNKGVRPQFDHFFPKDKHPYLALSFYNLIPSCSVCNSSLKGNKIVSKECNIHPYIEGFEESTRFTTIPSSYEDIVGLNPISNDHTNRMQVILKLLSEDKELNKRIKGNVKLFKLEEVYTEHADFVRELIRLSSISNSAYMKDIEILYAGLFDGEEELYRLIFGNYLNKEDFIKRPLAKLTRDILEGLEVYQKS